MKYSFKNDYSELCNSEIIDAIAAIHKHQLIGYGEDRYSIEAADLIREKINSNNADIHFIAGGTHANLIAIDSILTQSYMCVLAAKTGHIAVHEAGAIEATGHKIVHVPSVNGKIIPDEIDPIMELHMDEHMVLPKLVYISQTTELGTVYSKAEVEHIREKCDKWGLRLFVDGARLGAALTSPVNDLSIQELATLVDVFYIGATKNGGMLGEAIVITNDELKKDFRRNIKMRGGLLSKGALIAIQFKVLFENDLYYRNAQHANDMAQKLAVGITELGYEFMTEPVSNQIFPIFPDELITKLGVDYGFYVWESRGSGRSAIRLVTSWATEEEKVDEFINSLKDRTV